MYKKVSEEFNKLIEQQGGRTFKIKLESSSFVIDSGIKKIIYAGGSNAGDSITVGSAVSNYIEVIMEKVPHLITGQNISFDLGLEVNGAIEYVPMGIFRANKPEMTDYEIVFKAYDQMTQAEKNYASDLKYPTDTIKVMQEIAQKLGIEFITNISPITLKNPSTEENSSNVVFAGYTIREAIGYIAGLYGKFAVFNRLGQLEFRWYEESRFEIPVSKCYSFTKNESNYTVNKIIGTAADNTQYEAGSGITGVSFSNPFVTQEIVNKIHTDIGGFTYRGGETKFLGDCRIDVWDIVTGEDLFGNTYKLPVMEITHEIDGGLTTTVKSKASDSESVEDTFKGPVAKAMERTHAQLLIANNLIASKASIEYLEANYIKTNEIDAVTANIENAVITNLQGKFATIDYLETNYAEIDFANVQKESVGTLLADVGLISSETIVDGHVTGTLGAVQIDAGNITLGVLDAGTIEVVNLKAASITVGQINGYQIAPGAIDMNNLAESITNEIDTASTNAQTALNEALKAFNESQAAALVAGTAQATADGKNTVFYQTEAPSGTHKINDVWFDTNDSNKMYYWNGSAWTARQFGTNAIANASITNALIADATIQSAKIAALDAAKITTGTLNAARIGTNSITANKMVIADFTNYATANENFAAANIPTGTYGGTSVSGGYIVKPTATNQYLMFCDYTPCNLKSGEQIYYEMSIKGAVSGSVTPKIWYYNANHANNTGSSGTVNHTISTTETVISGTITVSSAADSSSYFLVGISDNNSSKKQIYVREVKFIRKSAGNLIVDGAITAGKLSANAVTADKINAGAVTTAKIAAGAVTAATIASSAITADKIAASAVTTDKLSVGNGGNLYAMGYDTFENIPNTAARIYYQKASTTTVSIDTTTAYYGSRCLKIISTSTDGYVLLGDSSNGYGCIPVVSGKTYIISAWMKASATTTAQLWVVGHTSRNATNSKSTSSTHSIGTSWTRVYMRYTATADYPYISIRIDNDTNGATLWVDAIQIETGTTTQEPSAFSPAGSTVIDGARIVTGSITANSIASSAITTDKLAANSITAAKIASAAITSAKIAAGAVTAEKISVSDLSALKAKIGGFTIDSNSIHNGTWGADGSVMMCIGSTASKSIAGSPAISGWCFTAGDKFGVTKTGALYASNANITGNSAFGDWKIYNTYITNIQSFSDGTKRSFQIGAPKNIHNSAIGLDKIRADNVSEWLFILDSEGNVQSAGTISARGNITTTGNITATGGFRSNAGFNVASSNSYAMGIYDGGNALHVKTNVGEILFRSDSGARFANYANNAYVPIYASAFTVRSSKKYKIPKGIMAEDETNKLLKLDVVKFDYINGDKGQYGLYAEDVVSIIPECVVKNEKNEVEGIDYSKLVPFLIKKAQMQEKKINYLENMVTHLIGIAMNPERVKTYQI